VLAVKRFLPAMVIEQSGRDCFVKRGNPDPVDTEYAQRGLELARKALKSGEYQMVILDEINVAVDYGLVPVEELLAMIRSKPPTIDLILTGRYAAAAVVDCADMVSEVREIRHHYSRGITERPGIEY